MIEKINIKDILKGHFTSLNIIPPFRGRIIPSGDAILFVWIPLFISTFISLFFSSPTDNSLSYISTVLSIFIGLFLNLLVFLFSFLENKHEVQDKSNRYRLIKETFYNIAFMIILCILALILIFILDLRNNGLIYKTDKIRIYIQNHYQIVCWTKIIIRKGISLLIYFSLTEVFLTLLMIMKRVGKLFSTELDQAAKK